MAKKITKWEPDDFELEMTTHWSFPKRGNWATHDAKWRGNWSPYIPRNIILRYSNEGDVVLDQFVGGGTTLVGAKLLNRDIIGVDVNDVALDRCKEKVDFEHEGTNGKVNIRKGDARNLDFLSDDSIDLIWTCTTKFLVNWIRLQLNRFKDINDAIDKARVVFLNDVRSILDF